MERNCSAFSMGFCPYEEFYVESVTERCPHPHVSAAREGRDVQPKGLPLEHEALSTYKSILESIDKRVAVNSAIVQEDVADDGHRRALAKCQELIDACTTEACNSERLYRLLVVHGRLVQDIVDSKDRPSVCANCGSLKNSQKCAHMFCEKIKRLRSITGELEAALQKTGGE